jgi:hypothetical protein
MKSRHLSLLAVIAAAVSPTLALAGPEQVSLVACAHAFAASLSAASAAPAPRFKVAELNGDTGTIASLYAREFTFDLTAHDPKTGAPVAKATCSASRDGTVTALSALTASLPAPVPSKFAAQF